MSGMVSPSRPLPIPLSSFVGREQECATVAELLNANRLVTLTGAGGSGKTRLALAVAEAVQGRFAAGAVFIPLAPLDDPQFVMPAIAQALGISELYSSSPDNAVQRFLHQKSLLLVLDNFEYLLDAAPLVAELLGSCSNVRALVTSRTRLRLRGERQFVVEPLPVPEPQHDLTAEGALRSTAVQLFVQRAAELQPDFALNDTNAEAITAICRRLDGLPLAIELAAARVTVLPPARLLERLEHSLDLLTGGPRDAPARQRTLRDTVAWSYGLLTAEEQRLFRQVSVFAGGGTLEAVEALRKPDIGSSSVLDILTSLVDCHLLQCTTPADGQPRFIMLETIREYARELLVAAGEATEVRRRHTEFYLNLAMAAHPDMRRSASRGPWLTRLDLERDNLRLAFAWCAETGEAELGLRALPDLNQWYFRRGVSEWRQRVEQLLGLAAQVPPGVRAQALWAAGYMAHHQGDLPEARRVLEESIDLWRELGDSHGLALSLRDMAASLPLDDPVTRSMAEESVALYRRGTDPIDPYALAWSLNSLGGITRGLGDTAAARRAFEETLAIGRELDDTTIVTWARGNLAGCAYDEGGYEGARRIYEELLPITRDDGDRRNLAMCQALIGRIALRQGDFTGGARSAAEGLANVHELGIALVIANCMTVIAESACALGERLQATRLFAAATAICERYDIRPRPGFQPDPRSIESCRASLGEQDFATVWAEGCALTQDDAVAEALAAAAEIAAEPEPEQRTGATGGLSPREAEVLRLLASGLTNREIADVLVLSVRTVERHIENIYAKLGVHGQAARAAVASYATRCGLLPEA